MSRSGVNWLPPQPQANIAAATVFHWPGRTGAAAGSAGCRVVCVSSIVRAGLFQGWGVRGCSVLVAVRRGQVGAQGFGERGAVPCAEVAEECLVLVGQAGQPLGPVAER